jgi:ATP-dependent 26S proteasome regulatory subunit
MRLIYRTLLTNGISPALLRPGRFEVQIEVPPPRTNDQRVSILKVHTSNMHQAGRLLVSDPPEGTAAARYLQVSDISIDCLVVLSIHS